MLFIASLFALTVLYILSIGSLTPFHPWPERCIIESDSTQFGRLRCRDFTFYPGDNTVELNLLSRPVVDILITDISLKQENMEVNQECWLDVNTLPTTLGYANPPGLFLERGQGAWEVVGSNLVNLSLVCTDFESYDVETGRWALHYNFYQVEEGGLSQQFQGSGYLENNKPLVRSLEEREKRNELLTRVNLVVMVLLFGVACFSLIKFVQSFKSPKPAMPVESKPKRSWPSLLDISWRIIFWKSFRWAFIIFEVVLLTAFLVWALINLPSITYYTRGIVMLTLFSFGVAVVLGILVATGDKIAPIIYEFLKRK